MRLTCVTCGFIECRCLIMRHRVAEIESNLTDVRVLLEFIRDKVTDESVLTSIINYMNRPVMREHIPFAGEEKIYRELGKLNPTGRSD